VRPIVIIPARRKATRLPDKPLADIAGRPMIAHVVMRALRAGIGPVAVATDDEAIARAAEDAGAEPVMTRADHASGSDRVDEALRALDPFGRHDAVVNLQGDLPLLDPALIRRAVALLDDEPVDIGTLAARIVEEREGDDPNVVKVVGAFVRDDRLRALYFTRARAPWGEGTLYHHIGLYAFRRAALARFVSLPVGDLEARERLEQLRALEAGMRIDVAVVETVPVGVDTPADLERARRAFAESEGRA